MMCVALTGYQFISQLCCLNYCQNDWFMFLLQALEKLIIWAVFFFLHSCSSRWLTLLWAVLFSLLKWFGLATTYFRLLKFTSWICILSKFAFWCQWDCSDLKSTMILLHHCVNYIYKCRWKDVTFHIIWNCTVKFKDGVSCCCCFSVSKLCNYYYFSPHQLTSLVKHRWKKELHATDLKSSAVLCFVSGHE